MSEPTKEIVIAATANCTSVGLNSEQTALHVRAGIMRHGAIAIQRAPVSKEDDKPFYMAPVLRAALDALPPEISERPYFTRREGHLLRLARLALKDPALVAALGKIGKKRPPLYLALPEHETTRPLDHASMLADLATFVPDTFDKTDSRADGWRGRAGGLLAIGAAIQDIQTGKHNFAIAGATDTFYDVYILERLYFEKRCKQGRWIRFKKDIFLPGEGAGFLLLAEKQAALAAGFTPLASISPVTEDFEPGYWGSKEPYLGEGLARAVRKLFEQTPPPAPVAEVFSTMNGETYWAREWGVTRIRNNPAFAENEEIHTPVQNVGDLGAAFPAVLAALAAIGINSGYRKSPALVYGSSDAGQRAAALIYSTQTN
jgi:3-oxoacyl-[acyl-carrier-protein] synthase-1